MRLLPIILAVALFASCDGSSSTVEGKDEHSILLTAEKGKAIGPEIKYMKEWKAFGWFTAKDRVEWDVDVEKGGEYAVHMEWSVSDEEAGKGFIIEAPTDSLTGVVEKSGSWETYKEAEVGTINLEEGSQKIIFRSKADFDKGALLDLRQLRLVKR